MPDQCNEESLHTPHILFPQGKEKNNEMMCDMYSIEDDDDEGVLRICESNEVAAEEILRKEEQNVPKVVVHSDVKLGSIAVVGDGKEKDRNLVENKKAMVQDKLKECLEKKQNAQISINANQGVLITPIPIERLKRADTAVILLKQKVDPFVNVPRKTVARRPVTKTSKKEPKPTDEKERQRESNRLAQTRSRERKRRYMIDLQEKMDLLKEENERLLSENTELRNENYRMKAVLMCHRNCEISKDPEISKCN